MNETTPTSEPAQPTSMTSSAAKDPVVRLFIFAAIMIVIGLWCLFDGDLIREDSEYKYVPFSSENINQWAKWAFNHYGPFVLLPPGIIVGIYGLVFMRRKLIADDKGIGYAGKSKIAWDEFKEIDSSLLKDKGILHLIYGDGKKLTLDSWKLKNFKDLVSFVESHLPPGLNE